MFNCKNKTNAAISKVMKIWNERQSSEVNTILLNYYNFLKTLVNKKWKIYRFYSLICCMESQHIYIYIYIFFFNI